MIPSIKTIRERLFQDKPCLSALNVRQVMEGKGIDNFESVQKLRKRCLHKPSLEYEQMTALNEILGGYGDEAVYEEGSEGDAYFVYINMGDSYTTTVIYETGNQRFLLMSVGDYIDSKPKLKFV